MHNSYLKSLYNKYSTTDKTASSTTKYQGRRMAVTRGKIERLRKKQEEKIKKSEKNNAAKMKEIKKQQEALIKNQPMSAADRMRENFNSFAGTNFAGNSPTALPTVQAPAPINSQRKMAMFCEKATSLVNDIISLRKVASNQEHQTDKQTTENPTPNNKNIHVQGWQSWLTNPDRLGSKMYNILLAMTGLGRTDNELGLKNPIANVARAPNVTFGSNIKHINNGYTRGIGYTTNYNRKHY